MVLSRLERKEMSMMTLDTNYAKVMDIVHHWPIERRLALMQDVLESMSTEISRKPRKRKTLHKALGLLATNAPPPTDEDIQQMLDEYRMEKYG
jgi:hypothetical protein